MMVGFGNKYTSTLPTFSKAALTTKSGKFNSEVSALWANLFDKLRNKFETLSDRINDKLTSHCNKKGSNQVMVKTPTVSGMSQIFRSGWQNRGATPSGNTLWEAMFSCNKPAKL